MIVPAYLTDAQVALSLNRRVPWFRKHRKELEARGFPRKDKLIGGTLRADLDAWLARQRTLSDRGEVAPATNPPLKENTDAL